MATSEKAKNLPYAPDEFAARHGLSVKAAIAVLLANSSSKRQADIGATNFLRAIAARKAGHMERFLVTKLDD